MATMPLGARATSPAADRDRLRTILLVGAAILLFALQQGDWRRALAFDLPDNDDLMRLVQVRDLLAGQGWFDTLQHRYLPPAGASMHWSRFVDLPIAGLIALLRPFAGERAAEGLAILLWPPLVFCVYLAVLWFEVRRSFGTRAAGLACLAAAQSVTVMLWSTGRIDHHNVQATALAAAALAVAAPGAGWRRPALAGLLCGLSLAVGLETLPFVAAVGAGAAVAWCLAGRPAALPLAAFGAALAAASLLFFAAGTSPGHWWAAECDALSPPWLLLTLGGGLGAVALAAGSGRLGTRFARFAATAAGGVSLVAAFAGLFPACLRGPYAALPDLARTGWLDAVSEAAPIWKTMATSPGVAFGCLVSLGAGLVAGLGGARRESGARRAALAMAAAFAGIGLAITVFQMRGIYIGAALVPVAAGFALDRGIALLERPGRVRAGVATLLLALGTLNGPLDVVWWAREALRSDAPPDARMVRSQGSCVRPASIAALDAVPAGLILSSTELGPAVLAGTRRQAIIAAGYHRNGEGIAAGVLAESGREDEVRDAMRRFGADYLLVCRDWKRFADKPDVFVRGLVAGEAVPWLRPVPLADAGGLLLWRRQEGDAAQP